MRRRCCERRDVWRATRVSFKPYAVEFLEAVSTYGFFLGAFPDPHPRKNEPQSKRGTNLPELFVVVA